MLNIRKDSIVTHLGLFNYSDSLEIQKYLNGCFIYAGNNNWFSMAVTQSEIDFLYKNDAVFENESIYKLLSIMDIININYVILYCGFLVKYSDGVLMVKKGVVKIRPVDYPYDPELRKLRKILDDNNIIYGCADNFLEDMCTDYITIG